MTGKTRVTDDFEDFTERLIARFDSGSQSSVRDDIGALRDRGVASWADLVAVLDDQAAGEDRATACWLLGCAGDERALGPLAAALHGPDPLLRGAAARALGGLGSPRAVPELIAVLQTDASPDTRTDAAYALGLLGDHRAVDPLLAKLADASELPRLRGFAAEALAGSGERRAVPALVAALGDTSAEVRFWAAFALGQLGDPAALSALQQLARTDEATLPGWWSVSDEAAAAVESIKARPSS
jgi:HEAT repeat protein